MILLTIDTSGKNGTLGLARRDGQRISVLAEASLAGQQYSAELIPKFSGMLEQLSLKKSEVDAIAVVSGPGSFTGLRVGLAAAKGLAETLQKTLTAISALEAIAVAGQASGRVLSALDAGRSEVFLGHCEVQEKWEVRTLDELLVKQSEMAHRVGEIGVPLLTAEEKIGALAREANLPVQLVSIPGAELLAALGFAQLDRGKTVRPDDLDANYIRRSDAEIFSAPNV